MYVIVSRVNGQFFCYFDGREVCFTSDVSLAVSFKNRVDALSMLIALDRTFIVPFDSVDIKFVEV